MVRWADRCGFAEGTHFGVLGWKMGYEGQLRFCESFASKVGELWRLGVGRGGDKGLWDLGGFADKIGCIRKQITVLGRWKELEIQVSSLAVPGPEIWRCMPATSTHEQSARSHASSDAEQNIANLFGEKSGSIQ